MLNEAEEQDDQDEGDVRTKLQEALAELDDDEEETKN